MKNKKYHIVGTVSMLVILMVLWCYCCL